MLLCYFSSLVFTWCFTPQAVSIQNVTDRATIMITKYEGYSPTAYLDLSWYYSIWFGTRSYEWEIITRSEAQARMSAIVRQSVRRIIADFPHEDEDTIVALTSLAFNCHKGYLRVKNEWFDVMLEKGFCLPPWFRGLIARRAEEIRLIFGDVKDK